MDYHLQNVLERVSAGDPDLHSTVLVKQVEEVIQLHPYIGKSVPKSEETAVICAASALNGEIKCFGTLSQVRFI